MDKQQQAKLLSEIMQADEKDGLYEPTISKMKTTQTAVGWLFQKMTEQGTNPYWDMRFIQAKQMEKEQIENAFSAGYDYPEKDCEQYYNETYESNL